MLYKEMLAYMQERQRIFTKKEAGKAKPWTADPILQSYSFCNNYRQDDRVTRWVNIHWRDPCAADANIWFLMAVARLTNWEPTMEAISPAVINRRGKVAWTPEYFREVMAARREKGLKMYSHAYTIRPSAGYATTYESQIDMVFGPMWELRAEFPKRATRLAEVADWLKTFEGIGEFMAAQIVADIKYTPRFDAGHMTDWWSYVSPGPGSRRGLARVMELPYEYRWTEDDWKIAFYGLKAKLDPMLEKARMPMMHSQDLQNCLCEFDKYRRLQAGDGNVRAKYDGRS